MYQKIVLINQILEDLDLVYKISLVKLKAV